MAQGISMVFVEEVLDMHICFIFHHSIYRIYVFKDCNNHFASFWTICEACFGLFVPEEY